MTRVIVDRIAKVIPTASGYRDRTGPSILLGNRMTNRDRIGWGTAGLVTLMLAASAIDKISGSAHALHMTASFGIPPSTYRLLGVVELTSALLFLVRRTGILGTLLLAAYMGGAIATHLQHQQDILFPLVIEGAVWLSGLLRFPELTARLRGGAA